MQKHEVFEQDSLHLMVEATNRCQLDCIYCYYGPKGRDNMNVPAVEKGIGNFLSLFPNLRRLHISFLGGEPLLAWKEIQDLVGRMRQLSRARGLKFYWGITSNLISLDQNKIEFMQEAHGAIHCSIDGPSDLQNKNRPFCGGRPSHDCVSKNVSLALKLTPNDTARATIRPEDADQLPRIANDLLSRGFRSVGLFPDFKADWDMERMETFARALACTIREHQGEKPGSGPIVSCIKHYGVKDGENFGYCGAGKGLWAIDIKGGLYYCHHFSSHPEFCIISLANAEPSAIFDAIVSSPELPYEKPDMPVGCKDCSAREFCAGGCWGDHLLASGTYEMPHKKFCEMLVILANHTGELVRRDPPALYEGVMRACWIFKDECENSCQEGCEVYHKCSTWKDMDPAD